MPNSLLSRSPTGMRIAVAGVLVLLLLPTVVAGVSGLTAESGESDVPSRETAQDVTLVSSQHGSVVAVHTPSREVIWRHDDYAKYYDVDPINDSVVLFAARIGDNESEDRRAVLMNWRTGEVLSKFEMPADTHDVDYLGNGKYVVADKVNHRVYVYRPATETVTWEYNFTNHFRESAGGEYEGDWTHLNDVDAVNNGSAFVVDPRNFDRVMLTNKSEKRVEWTLGSEDDYDILAEQHNPVLLSQDPVTVLVADSENDRVVEYQKTDSGWEATWGYRGDLKWPRDADRLPNGNTMIADSGNDRVLVVTPDHEVVWSMETDKFSYDVERLGYGDEAGGPTMASMNGSFEQKFDQRSKPHPLVQRTQAGAEKGHFFAAWVLPQFVGVVEFYSLVGALLLGAVWTSVEAVRAAPSGLFEHRTHARDDSAVSSQWIDVGLGAVALLVGLASIFGVVIGGRYAGQTAGMSVLLFGIAVQATFTGEQGSTAEVENRLRSIVVPVASLLCAVTGVGMIVIADPAGVFLYYGIGIALLWQGVSLARKW